MDSHRVGISSLVVASLIHSGMPVSAEPVKKGLEYLRAVKEPEPSGTYNVALLISALVAANDEGRDVRRLFELTKRLENAQLQDGSWSYQTDSPVLGLIGGDRSNGQYAVLALRDAAAFGIPVRREVWEKIRAHWLKVQTAKGSWTYAGDVTDGGTGSMTATGISVLTISEWALKGDAGAKREDDPYRKGVAWLAENFSVTRNPGGGRTWLFYYLHSLARAGELSGERHFGDHDWYREGAEHLVATQAKGVWQGDSSMEKDPVLATSYALLFLARGPVKERKGPVPAAPEKPAPESKKTDSTKLDPGDQGACVDSRTGQDNFDIRSVEASRQIAEALDRPVTLHVAVGTPLRDLIARVARE